MIDNIKNIDIESILKNLSKDRRIFHNEQDFQFELARKINEKINKEKFDIRLEYYIGTEKKNKTEKENRIYVDILIIDKNVSGNDKRKAIAIELKYKTKKVESKDSFELNNEIYNLKNQGAKDWACYSIYKDLKRIEYLVNNNKKYNPSEDFEIEYYNLKNIDVIKGYVVFLTNDNSYRYIKMNGLFRKYSLNQENEEEKEVIKEAGTYNYINANNEVIDYENKDEIDNHPSIKGKPPIKLRELHTGKWSDYSIITKDEINTKHDIVIDQLVFEYPAKENS